MVSTSQIEAISEGFQRRLGGGSASANGTSIASRQLEQSLSDDGEAMSRSGPRPYRRRLFGFLTPMPRGARIFS